MRFDTLAGWLAWQETVHPVEMDLGLNRTRLVHEALGRGPVPPFPIVTVAGTNGKGSTVAFAQSLLTASGVRTGTYTSPHLVRYNERIRIDGEPVPDAVIMTAFERIDRARGGITLTYFEFGTLAAIDVFHAAQIDAAVLEVGIGGRLDAVNLFDADAAVVTPIDIDHVRWLGSDRESIGREKAGILRPGRPAVIADRDPPASLLDTAERFGAPCLRLGRDFEAEPSASGWSWQGPGQRLEGLPSPPLAGRFQLENAASALTALAAIGRLPEPDAARAGIETTRIEGRFQVVPGEVPVVLDIAHNPHAARSLGANLRASRPAGRDIAVAGLLDDKDAEGVVEAIGDIFAAWYVARPQALRGKPAEALAETVRARVDDAPVVTCGDVPGALRLARRTAARGDRIVVFGSCYTVGEVLARTGHETSA